jgi:hypothetical protein
VRWPLHLLNVILVLTIAALAAIVPLFRYWEADPPWVLVGVGGGVCLFFFALNLAIATLELRLEEDHARLRIWPWRRRVSWMGAEIRKVVRPTGVTAIRIIGAGGERIWLSQAWFSEFEVVLAEIERLARLAGAPIREVEK